jgi:dipeptidyl-peptidase-3
MWRRSFRRVSVAILLLAGGAACGPSPEPPRAQQTTPAEPRQFLLERVEDVAVVQLYADGFAGLPVREKTLIWHLSQAALAGRDIFYDQLSARGLEMREILEAILTHPEGVAAETLAEVQRYTKLFWINNGPYHDLTGRKNVLACTPDAFRAAAEASAKAGARFPVAPGESLDSLLMRLQPMFFDPDVAPFLTTKTPPKGQDILTASFNNLYAGVSMRDLAGFTERYGLNSRLVKRNGVLIEEVYRVGGRYDAQIREIIRHLEAARPFATEPMVRALDALIQWYRTGEAADRRAYDIAWVADQASPVDTINGFTETYVDPRGIKGSWEGLVYYVNTAKTEGIKRLAAEAQWFEDRMPWDPRYRKAGVKGITANAIDAVIEIGDVGPTTPIGINLPNDQVVREQHGSKSISLSNVLEAYDKSSTPATRQEFSWTPEEAARAARWAAFAGELTTNMHEVIGHASGQISARLQGKPEASLKEYYAALEEGRADLVGLYFVADQKMIDLGLVQAADHADVVRAEYEGYTRNALVQLRRIREGSQIEEDHMRNRQMIVHWLMANTKAIERRQRDGKTYYVMVDAQAFREGVGRLLGEVQRIKAEGDLAAARRLFDTHGIHFDPKLRDEVVARVRATNPPTYSGFVMPKLQPVYGSGGAITDVTISYPRNLSTQMLEYAAATKASRDAFLAAERAR